MLWVANAPGLPPLLDLLPACPGVPLSSDHRWSPLRISRLQGVRKKPGELCLLRTSMLMTDTIPAGPALKPSFPWLSAQRAGQFKRGTHGTFCPGGGLLCTSLQASAIVRAVVDSGNQRLFKWHRINVLSKNLHLKIGKFTFIATRYNETSLTEIS